MFPSESESKGMLVLFGILWRKKWKKKANVESTSGVLVKKLRPRREEGEVSVRRIPVTSSPSLLLHQFCEDTSRYYIALPLILPPLRGTNWTHYLGSTDLQPVHWLPSNCPITAAYVTSPVRSQPGTVLMSMTSPHHMETDPRVISPQGPRSSSSTICTTCPPSVSGLPAQVCGTT